MTEWMSEWINEHDPEQMSDVPRLPAYHWISRGSKRAFDTDQWSIWCTFCNRWHTHGDLGHRCEHCRPLGNYPRGYVLVDSGQTTTRRQVHVTNTPPAAILIPEPTTLYRLHARDSTLLYIGIAGNPGRRFEQHAGEKPWWGQVARITLEHFATRSEAADAERAAIRHERPLHNVIHAVRA